MGVGGALGRRKGKQADPEENQALLCYPESLGLWVTGAPAGMTRSPKRQGSQQPLRERCEQHWGGPHPGQPGAAARTGEGATPTDS